MFSYILLPMVIFAAGFNLDKHRFFRFGGYIAALGITGTVA
jgi:NhaP-type Na+/H+ or K+/H+ antiporter